MTDNEIIKALDCCNNGNCDEDCPFFFDRGNCYNLDDYALDLINRLQAEIEKVKPIHNSFERELECAKQEAIKEFVERLKEKKRFAYAHLGKTHYTVYEEDIDELVQEMRKENEE